MGPKDPVPSLRNNESTEPSGQAGNTRTRRGVLRHGLRAAAAAAAGSLGGCGAIGQGTNVTQSLRSLVLRDDQLAAKTMALSNALKASPQLQSDFINHPSEVVAQWILPADVGSAISPQRFSNANRVVYSVVSNDGFRTWVQQYAAYVKGTGSVDKSQIIKDLSGAIIRFGNTPLIQAIMEENELASRSVDENALAANPSLVPINLLYIVDFVFFFRFIAVYEAVLFLAFLFFGSQAVAARPTVTPPELRALAEAIISRGRELARSGSLDATFLK